jgi:hypothetical protein
MVKRVSWRRTWRKECEVERARLGEDIVVGVKRVGEQERRT